MPIVKFKVPPTLRTMLLKERVASTAGEPVVVRADAPGFKFTLPSVCGMALPAVALPLRLSVPPPRVTAVPVEIIFCAVAAALLKSRMRVPELTVVPPV